MATHCRSLAWEVPWTEELDRLQSMGLQKVRDDLVTKQQQQNYGEAPRIQASIVFNFSLSNGSEVAFLVSYCGFDLRFPDD